MAVLQRLLVKLYAILLRMYPQPFASKFGDEMLVTFQCLLSDAVRKDYFSLFRFVLREFSGILVGITKEFVMATLFSQRVRLLIWACMISLLLAMGTTISSWLIVPIPSENIMTILWMATGISIAGILYLALFFRYGTTKAIVAVMLFGLPIMSAVLQALWLSYVFPLLILFGLFLYTLLQQRDKQRA